MVTYDFAWHLSILFATPNLFLSNSSITRKIFRWKDLPRIFIFPQKWWKGLLGTFSDISNWCDSFLDPVSVALETHYERTGMNGSQTSSQDLCKHKMETFATIINWFQPLTIVANHSILDVCGDLDYASWSGNVKLGAVN